MKKEVEIAEPIVVPRPKEKEKIKPNKNDPWTVPAPYNPKTHPAPTPKAFM